MKCVIVLMNGAILPIDFWLDRTMTVCDKIPNAIIRIDRRKGLILVRMMRQHLKNIGIQINFDRDLVKTCLSIEGNVTIIMKSGTRYIVKRPCENVFSFKTCRHLFFDMDTMKFCDFIICKHCEDHNEFEISRRNRSKHSIRENVTQSTKVPEYKQELCRCTKPRVSNRDHYNSVELFENGFCHHSQTHEGKKMFRRRKRRKRSESGKVLPSRKMTVSIQAFSTHIKQHASTGNVAKKEENYDITNMFRGEVHRQSAFPEQPTDEDGGSLTYSFSRLTFSHPPVMNNEVVAVSQTPHSASPSRTSDYSVYIMRLLSFNHEWPHPESVQRKSVLAKCGFYFTGEADLVRCFDCGIGLKDWRHEDDSLFFHLRLSRDCRHVCRTYDRDIIQSYMSKIQDAEGSSAVSADGTVRRERSPKYRDNNERLKSFTNWDRGLQQTPSMLAEAGFYHTGTLDIVRCFYCDGGLQRWDPEDEPWVQHALWFPDCQYVKDVKGEEFISMIRSAAAAADNSSDEEEDEINMDTVADGRMHEYHKPIFSPVAQNVIAAGFSKAAVGMAIEIMSQQGKRMTKDAIISFLNEKKARGEILPTDTPRSETPEPEFDESTDEGLLQQRDYLNSILLCILCEARKSNILFLPCGHHKMCIECAEDVLICPLCEKEVVEKVRTFML